MRGPEARVAVLDVKPQEIPLSVILNDESLGRIRTGEDLEWEIFCNTHGQYTVIANLPRDIDPYPKNVRKYIDENINSAKCSSVSCLKRVIAVSRMYNLQTEPRRSYGNLIEEFDLDSTFE